jgi:hypothetical protein
MDGASGLVQTAIWETEIGGFVANLPCASDVLEADFGKIEPKHLVSDLSCYRGCGCFTFFW